MGLFDKIFSSNAPAATYSPKNEPEAWLAIMNASVCVDGDVSDVEVDKMLSLVIYKQIFSGHNIGDYLKPVIAAQKSIGSKGVIDGSVGKISESNKPTLLALIMELLLADGVLGDKEKEILEYLTTALSIDPNTAQKIVEVMLIKNKGNIVV